jgi:hypothetical protein
MIELFKTFLNRITEKSSHAYGHHKRLKTLLGLGLIRSRKPITSLKRERMMNFLSSL